MSSYGEGEIKESTVEEKKETTTKPEEPKRRVRRSRREEQTTKIAEERPEEKPTATAVTVPTIPKRLLNRIDKHDAYLTDIQREVRLLNRLLKKLTTRVNRVESRLAKAKAKAKKGVGSRSSSSRSSNSNKKKKGRSKR
jgi:hypothetical protein